jgi:hypothetical protein
MLATYIATYHVMPQERLRITRIAVTGSDVILEHNGASLGQPAYVEETAGLEWPIWASRPNGPHLSPYNAGPATGTRFFRLNTSP